MEEEAAMQRMASYMIHKSIVQKPWTITEYWPLPSDKKQEKDTFKPPTPEFIEKIRKAYNIKPK